MNSLHFALFPDDFERLGRGLFTGLPDIHKTKIIRVVNAHERPRKIDSFRNKFLEMLNTIGPNTLAPGLRPADACADR